MSQQEGIQITRLADAPGYAAARHHDVSTVRLQGLEAGPSEAFWVGLSWYLPGGGADESPTAAETVYVVLDGELVLTAGGQEHVLGPQDSVHLTAGTIRQISNRSPRPAALLVIIAQPRQPGSPG